MAEPTPFNITIDDSAPQIIYSPLIATSVEPSTDLGAGWIPYFNISGFNTFPGEEASGESLHITSSDGAVLTIGFTGTAIYLYGLADSASFSIALDNIEMQSHLSAARALNVSSDASTQVLASFIGLPQADHILSLTTRITNATSSSATSSSTGQVIFDRAVVTVSTALEGASIVSKTINDTEMQFTGSWTFVDDPELIPSGDHSYHITNRSGDQAQYTFQGSSVELNGLTNASAGLFNVTLSSDSDPEIFEQQTLSGFSSFLTYTTLFYATSLNDSANYTLTITNLENKTLALDGMNVTVLSGGNPVPSTSSSMQSSLSNGLPRSAIAAIVSACVLAFLFMAGVIAHVLWTRNRRRQWWEGTGEMGFNPGRPITSGPRHRRVRSAELVDVLSVHPGQGLNVTNPIGSGYDYRNIAGDESILEIGPPADGDSDSGHGHETGHKKSVSIPSFDNLPRERPTSASPTGRSSLYRRSLNLGRWSGWFGSHHRSSTQSAANRDSFVPDISIVAPIPTHAMRPVSLLARAHVRDSQSRRSSSATHLETGEAFLDLRRTSPFEVDFVKGSSGPQTSGANLNASPRSHSRDVLVSFLDVASSAASSIRGSTRSRRQRSSSNKSSSQNGNGKRVSRRSQNSSGYQSTSTGMWSLSLSIDPQPRRQRHSEEPVPITAVETDGSSRHPFSAVTGEAPITSQNSPTDSLPMSVSDINFRVDEEEEDPPEAGGRLRLPRHPPLPDTPLSFTFSSDQHVPEITTPAHSRQMSTASGASGDVYVAQTPLGRRLAEARAQAHATQGNRSYATLPPIPSIPPSTPTGSERRQRLAARSLPFLNLNRNHNGSS